MDTNPESLAAQLEQHPDYRVIRRLQMPAAYGERAADDDTTIRRGVYLDTETTGFDPQTEQIIELAMLAFEFTSDGRVFRVLDRFDEFNDPGQPIPPHIVTLTGISDDMVAGKKINQAAIDAFLTDTAIVIAHNAYFDRRFLENHVDGFERFAWGCSASQVDWQQHGFESAKLEYLAYRSGFFYEGHRAIYDCEAGLHLLATPVDGTKPIAELLEQARAGSIRLYAARSPFETKDLLKARGYRWNSGDNGKPKAWYRDVPQDELDSEESFLFENVFGRRVDLPKDTITAFNRFSDRL